MSFSSLYQEAPSMEALPYIQELDLLSVHRLAGKAAAGLAMADHFI